MTEPLRLTDIVRARLPIWLVALLLLGGLAAGLVAGAAGGYLLSRPTAAAACPDTAEVCAEFAPFWDAWQLARERFVDAEAADAGRLIEGAADGMLAALGDEGHTRYLTAEEAARWDEAISGSFEGIGAYIDMRDGALLIVAPIEGSPAAAAGLRAGDRILAVDGAAVTTWTVDDLVARVRGPAGTTVTLQLLRAGGEPFDVTITRASVAVPSVSWAMLPGDVALIQLRSFDAQATRGMRAALEAARAAGARGVVLDLRNNPGGLLSAAVTIASEFLPAGSPVLIEQQRDGERRTTSTDEAGVAQDLPLVVLINGASASAAEILAGALQDAGRATLIGETTVGTGTVLTPFRLDGGARLLLGTQEWRTPAGRLIRGQGVAPDQEVAQPVESPPLLAAEARELSAAELAASADLQLRAALAALP